KRLLSLQRVQPAGEDVAFAAAVPFPQLDRRIVIDSSRNIDRQRVQGFDEMQRRAADIAGGLRARGGGSILARSTAQKVLHPSARSLARRLRGSRLRRLYSTCRGGRRWR